MAYNAPNFQNPSEESEGGKAGNTALVHRNDPKFLDRQV